jgi:acyl-[acyl-carrier-protein]-phospholipid O-acyltransferase/long-chain-fatty-acid--[acyl-carrier-protein] ligase
MGGTGLIEGGTFLAIWAANAWRIPPWEAGVAAMVLAVAGFLASFAVPGSPPSGTLHTIERNLWRGTKAIRHRPRRARGVARHPRHLLVLAAGAVLVSEFAPLVSGTLAARQEVATLFLSVPDRHRDRFADREPPAHRRGLGSLCRLGAHPRVRPDRPVDRHQQFRGAHRWRLHCPVPRHPEHGRYPIDLAVIAVSRYVHRAALCDPSGRQPSDKRSQIIAANNVVNAGLTVLAVLAITGLLAVGVDVPGLIGALGFATLFVALASVWLLPETLFKDVIRLTLRVLYRVDVSGMEHMPKPGERGGRRQPCQLPRWRASGAFSPGKPTFAVINTRSPVRSGSSRS